MVSPAPRQPPGLMAATETAKEDMSPLWLFPCARAVFSSLRVLFEACREHPAEASPPRRAVAPGQGADGCPPTATSAPPRWPPLGRGPVPATRGSRAAAPCSGVLRAERAPSVGGRGRCAAQLGVPAPPGRLHPCLRVSSGGTMPARAAQQH